MFCTRLGGPSAGPMGPNRLSVEDSAAWHRGGRAGSLINDDKGKESKPNQPPSTRRMQRLLRCQAWETGWEGDTLEPA